MTKPESVEDYFAQLAPGQRRALQKLRVSIRAAVPDAEECVSYAMPAFRKDGKVFAIYAAWKNHCAIYPGAAAIAEHQKDLRGYEQSKGAVCVPLDRPMPAALVRKLVRARIAGNAAKAKPRGANRTDPAVAEFLRTIEHPLKKEAEAARKIVLGVSPSIHEGLKWNSMSFRTKDYFATWNWRSRDSLQFVFHRGAKVKDNSTASAKIPDPAGLIRWLAKERCLVTVGDRSSFARNRTAFEAIVRAWIMGMERRKTRSHADHKK